MNSKKYFFRSRCRYKLVKQNIIIIIIIQTNILCYVLILTRETTMFGTYKNDFVWVSFSLVQKAPNLLFKSLIKYTRVLYCACVELAAYSGKKCVNVGVHVQPATSNNFPFTKIFQLSFYE